MLPQQMDQMDPILLPDFLGRGQEMLTYADKSRPSVGMAGPGAGSAGHEGQNNQEEWQLICWWFKHCKIPIELPSGKLTERTGRSPCY